MTTEKYDIRLLSKGGQQVFENLPNDIRPRWAKLILSCFDNYVKDVPTSIHDLYPIIDDKNRWKDAHKQFTKIRVFGLDNKKYKPEIYLRLAELVAKVTYNASGEPAPFDSDSGYYIPSFALKTSEHFKDNELEEKVKTAILLFSSNKRFEDFLTTATNDMLLHNIISDILCFDWDPMGINEIETRDEHMSSYVREIFNLVKSKAERQEIANKLYQLETEDMEMEGNIEKCITIADKILKTTK